MTAFTVFRERHYEPYVQYAALRIGQYGAAERVVAAAFTELAVSWTVALGSAGPAAIAWDILRDHIGQAVGERRRPCPFARSVQSLQMEAQVLHRRLQLSSERVAEVLGVPVEDICGLLPASDPRTSDDWPLHATPV
ncbi:hypothetical protein [Streptomyces sp. NPDC058625]|uniref:hypothetical protein n=1 Tax=Streptomyces sp. NPDC058625 TaxID=3346564 RepID=UPI003663AF3A